MPSPPQEELRTEKKEPNAKPSEETPASDKGVKLAKFIRLMETVYGSFRLIENPETWTPPPMVGCHKGRYLWTDAFGVINFLTLWKETGDDRFRILACRLICAVHDVLGSDRSGEHRLPRATEENPLAGGLRIGKEDSTGWNQDGQYLHYHCVWMFALNRTTIATEDPIWNEMAMKLGQAVIPHFWIDPKNHMRGTWWKISTDMTRNLTDSQGYIDPLDCFLVFAHMQAVSDAYGTDIHLDDLVADFGKLCRNRTIKQRATDPLDLGMGLWTAHWLGDYEHWAYNLLRFNCRSILQLTAPDEYARIPISLRTAYREMGMVMGLQLVDPEFLRHPEWVPLLRERGESILRFWEQRLGTAVDSDDRPITCNMMASALIPGAWEHGYFGDKWFDNWMFGYEDWEDDEL